ncbi:MAG TPA: HupE/UreJ family protein [Candidatus Acidoferrales bacterium]|nr:HupE/UreJ family protein [Candidatus Acidoferrales bacterium]
MTTLPAASDRRIANPPPINNLPHILLFLVLPLCAGAHDIPNDVTVQMFLKPEGQHLNLLVRVPLRAVRDIVFPERGPGYLDIARTEPLLPDACTQWLSDFIELYEDQTRLPNKPRVAAARISLESDKSFESYEQAAAHITGPSLPADTNVVWNQTLLDVWFDYPIRSDRSAFAIHPELGRLGLRVVTALRFLPPGGAVRAFEFTGDPGLVRLDPRWHQAAIRFVHQGFLHILDGTDHLLFLLCLVIPFRSFRALVPVVTSFTVAHSITLIASAYDLGPGALWFPPLIETLIAVSIVYMALENIVGGASLHRRWMIAFGFGLVHGFGFSFALRQTLQFAGSHLLASLLSFNVGVELGQLLVLLVLIPLLELCFRFVVAERMGTIILSALVAHTGWHWMLDRADRLSRYHFQWPVWTAAVVVSAMRWAMVAAILAAAVWLVRRRKTAP